MHLRCVKPATSGIIPPFEWGAALSLCFSKFCYFIGFTHDGWRAAAAIRERRSAAGTRLTVWGSPRRHSAQFSHSARTAMCNTVLPRFAARSNRRYVYSVYLRNSVKCKHDCIPLFIQSIFLCLS